MVLASCVVETVMHKEGWVTYCVVIHSCSSSSLVLIPLLPLWVVNQSIDWRQLQPVTWQPFSPVVVQQSAERHQREGNSKREGSSERECTSEREGGSEPESQRVTNEKGVTRK